MTCVHCGGPLIPLLTSSVCKNECDKLREELFPELPTQPIDFDDAKTGEFVLVERCPSCKSIDVEDFDVFAGSKHCWKCGDVFTP